MMLKGDVRWLQEEELEIDVSMWQKMFPAGKAWGHVSHWAFLSPAALLLPPRPPTLCLCGRVIHTVQVSVIFQEIILKFEIKSVGLGCRCIDDSSRILHMKPVTVATLKHLWRLLVLHKDCQEQYNRTEFVCLTTDYYHSPLVSTMIKGTWKMNGYLDSHFGLNSKSPRESQTSP